MLKLGIRTKILMLIMMTALLPLLLLNLFWTSSQRQALIDEARSRQALIAASDADQVNEFINGKVRALIIHSQSPTLQQFDLARTPLELGTLLYQDKDLMRAALVDQKGEEFIAMTSDLKRAVPRSVKNEDAFKVVNYFAGNQFISPVSIDRTGQPMVTIAIPLVTFSSPQELGSLSTSEPGVIRTAQDIKGALIVQASLKNLWSSVLSTSNNPASTGGGYAYVVNDKGIVLAHPDDKLTNNPTDVSSTPIVALFKTDLASTSIAAKSLQSDSEKGIEVMATYQKIPATSWAVVFEEPMSSIYQSVNQVAYLGLAISVSAIIIMGFLSISLSRYITKPILIIAASAKRIGLGDFSTRVIMPRGDEIGTLATSINSMGQNLQAYITSIATQRRQLEIILNSTTDGILAIDSNGIIIVANQATAHLAKQKAEMLIGKKIQNVFPWTKETQPFVIDYQATKTDIYSNLEYKDSDKRRHYIDLIVVQAANQTIITIHDQTKSRELDTMKSDFVAIAAHELRTPLSKIRGYLDLMKDTTDPTMTKNISRARQSAEELSSLISNLLDVSGIEQSSLAVKMEKIDLAESTKQVVEGMQFAANTKQIVLTYNGPDRNKYVAGDQVALTEVIDNLVDNAIKYTPENGNVTVNFDQLGSSYVVRVQDNGIGIPANAIPYLFTKFYRVHTGPESGNKGNGLGLFIAKSIVERHNGTITVASEGHGTVFKVTIPIFDESSLVSMHNVGEIHGTERHGWTTKDITR